MRLYSAKGSGGVAVEAALRWMSFVSSAIYALYWVKDDPSRLVPDPAGHPALSSSSLSNGWGETGGTPPATGRRGIPRSRSCP